MQLTRRQLFAHTIATLAVIVMPSIAWPQSYPSKTIRVVVPYPAGGTTDVIARGVTQALTAIWGQTVVVENRAGAGTLLGAEAVAKAAPDGYTLLATAEATFVVNPYLYAKLPYRGNDFIPISGLAVSTHALVAHSSLPVKRLSDLITLARAKPGELNYGTFGVGSSAHLNMEMLQNATGIKLTPVHYKGAAPMVTDLIAGQVPLAFAGMTLAAEPLKALDHDMAPEAILVPFGVLELNRGPVAIHQPMFAFGHSKGTRKTRRSVPSARFARTSAGS